MFRLLLVTFLAISTFGALGNTVPGPGLSRITGGTPVENNDYPYVCAIMYHYPGPNIHIQRCTGAIVSSWHVLSSGYCLEGAVIENMYVRAGSRISTSGGVISQLESYKKPDNYAVQPRQGDIALMRLREPLIPSNTISMLSIPPEGTVLPDNYPAKLAAWGFETESGPQLDYLKELTIYTINQGVCRERFTGVLDVGEDTICGGVLDQQGVGACTGDWGAPMVIGNVVVGLVSHYNECGNGFYPDIFVKIADYTNWILAESAN